LLNGEEGLLRCKVIPYERFINESISRHWWDFSRGTFGLVWSEWDGGKRERWEY
jgi:hypothetical protein